MTQTIECTIKEKMAIYAARQLKSFPEEQALIGIGLPVLASQIAKKMWCPDLKLIIENGSFDLDLKEIPFSLFGARLTYGCSAQLDNTFALSGLKRGRIKIGFIGGAQVDKYGNVNSTQVGTPKAIKARIAGSGGAVDIGCYAENTFIVIEHTKRSFVENVDYITTPGWIVKDHTNGGVQVHRSKLGLTGGPRVVISNLGIMKFDSNGEMYLDRYFSGVTLKQIIENTGFEIDVSRAKEVEPITEEEVNILRTKVDPLNLYGTR